MENPADSSLQQSVAQPVNTGQEKKAVAICEHVKDDGIRCGAPALRDRHFCYFHSRAHSRTIRIGDERYTPPVMESKQALQIAVTHALQALTRGDIKPRFANSVFYGVHLAAKVLRMSDTPAAPVSPEIVTEMPRTMQCILEGRPAPEPADYAPENIQKLAGHLLRLDKIAELHDSLRESPYGRAFDLNRIRLDNHYYACDRLMDMGLFDKYNLNPEIYGPPKTAKQSDKENTEKAKTGPS